MGRSLFELSLFDKAILKFRTITAGYDNREPRNSMIRSTYYWLGESHYCKGELDDAIKSTSVILQYGNFREKEDAHYSLGWSYFEKNDLASRSKAKSHFEALLRDYPNSAHSLKSKLKLAEIEIEEGNAIVAEKIIESLQQNEIHKTFFERNINILKQTEFLIGLLYMKKNDYKTALDHFLKAEDTSDQKLKQKIYYHAGVCYSNLKNIKEAKSYLTIASDTPADEAIKVLAQSSLADVYYQNRNSYSDLELSISAYTDLISVYTNHPLNLEWRTKLATALRAKNDDDGAIRILNKVLDENMDEWQKAQMDIGDILMESSPPRYAEAVDHYQKIIPSLKNKEFQELANLKYGISLSKTNKNTDAIQVFQNLIKTAKNEDIIIDAYRYSAQSFSKENDLTYAVKHYEDLISKYPNQRDVTDVRNEAIKIYQQLKDSANAIKHLTEIFNAESNHDKKAEALYQLAGHDIQLQQNNNIETAKEKLLRIINDFKSTKIAPKACFDLAQLYESKEMNKEAISFYQKAIDEFTNDEITAKSHFQIGQYYYQNKKYELASQHYEKMKPADLNDDDPSKEEKTLSMQVNKADSYYMLEKYSIAKDEYMALIRKDTHNVFYRVRYARSCLKSKTRIGDAINVIEKIDANQQTQETEELLEELKTARKNTSQIE